MKKVLCFLMFFIILLGKIPSFAEDIALYLDGKKVMCDPAPIIAEGRTLIPARALFEDMGATVEWLKDLRQVEVLYKDTNIKMTIDSKTAVVNNKAIGLDVPPTIISGRTMIPLRFVGEAIGAEVLWNGDTRRIDITSPSENMGAAEGEEPSSKPTVIISELEFLKKQDHDVLSFSASGKYTLKTMNLNNPQRLVFDIQGANFENGNLRFEDGDSARIRIGSHDGYARIVAESDAPIRYIYSDNGGAVNIKFYQDKKNFDFLGGNEKQIIFPDGAVLTASSDDKTVTVKVRGVSLEDENINVGDSLVSSISVAGNTVTAVLKMQAEAKVEGNKVTLLYSEEEKDEIKPKENLVVLDAGHGGSDPGSLGYNEDKTEIIAKEKDMNLKITLMVEKMLNERGIKTYLTRSDDTYVSLADRADVANKKNASLFVSIHNNSIPDPDYKGSMVLYYSTSSAGKTLASNILSKMTKAAGTIDRGLRDGTNMAVIRRTNMPAVIVECGCLTNSEELSNLMDDLFLEKLAFGITEGIVKTLN